MASTLPAVSDCCSTCSGLSVTIVSTVAMLAGNGPPEGVVTGVIQGQVYTDLLTGSFYKFIGTVGQNTGWI